mmetsp:Transcript_59166/g.114166  ORF Transcript_59166/g.114166 Transcript_59166/m.114166 type:complete len:88 (+) Transcript_59166:192-455(+)
MQPHFLVQRGRDGRSNSWSPQAAAWLRQALDLLRQAPSFGPEQPGFLVQALLQPTFSGRLSYLWELAASAEQRLLAGLHNTSSVLAA